MSVSTEAYPEPENQSRVTPGRKSLFTFCLLISLTIHAVTAVLVLFSSTGSQHAAVTHFIDLTATPLPAAVAPEIHAPAPTDTRQALPEPEKEQTQEKGPAAPPAPQIVSPEIISTPLGLGMTHGFFKSLAEGRSLREEIRVYYFEILEKINAAWWQKAGTLSESAQQDGIVDISIGNDGVLLGAQVVSTTGSGEVDRAIIEVLKEASPFAPPPVSFGQDSFRAPLRIAAPSHLFRLKNK